MAGNQSRTCAIIGRSTTGSICFGIVVGQRPKPGPLAADENDGVHQPVVVVVPTALVVVVLTALVVVVVPDLVVVLVPGWSWWWWGR